MGTGRAGYILSLTGQTVMQQRFGRRLFKPLVWHDDLAHPKSDDTVSRQSTRLARRRIHPVPLNLQPVHCQTAVDIDHLARRVGHVPSSDRGG